MFIYYNIILHTTIVIRCSIKLYGVIITILVYIHICKCWVHVMYEYRDNYYSL